MPQIMMLNHAAWVNKTRSDKRNALARAEAEKPKEEMFEGKPLSELTSEEYAEYLGA